MLNGDHQDSDPSLSLPLANPFPAMKQVWPRYLLFADVSSEAPESITGDSPADSSSWQFVLHSVDGADSIKAVDSEHGASQERLALLAVVRGLEALEQPSLVTLMTTNASIARGIRRGLKAWRRSGWKWERFGRLVPVRNCDLWQRIDQAMNFHQVKCRYWRFDMVESANHMAAEANVQKAACGAEARTAGSHAGHSRSAPSRDDNRTTQQWARTGINEPALMIIRPGQQTARSGRIRLAESKRTLSAAG